MNIYLPVCYIYCTELYHILPVGTTVAPVLSGHLNWPHKTGGHLLQVPTWRLSSDHDIRYCCFHTFRKLEVEIQNKGNVYFTLHGSLLYCSPLKPCVFVLMCYFKFFLRSKFLKKIFPGISLVRSRYILLVNEFILQTKSDIQIKVNRW